MIKIGSVIDDRYEILKEVGRGGMSVVYLAMDNRLNKSLVVKDIRKRGNSNNELLINSLVAEANMLKKLDHGALPKIYDIIESTGDIYVVMDYIEGESLKERMKREKKIPVNDVIDWGKQLCSVLGYLHTRKPNPIIYRDMKPDNVMITPEGKIKLIDFGIAREFKSENTSDTTVLGTKLYAAPEQASGRQTDARSDIYSLGVTLYYLVTGKSKADSELKPIRHWDPSLPEGLEHIIAKCTEAEPNDRYQSCEELLYDLENINKLTEGYRKKLFKQLNLFLIPLVLFIGFTTTSSIGYSGIKNDQFQDYMNLVNQSSRYLIDGNETKAIELLEHAIANVDRRRPEAYINLLDLYINRGEVEAGLAKIQSYMNDNYGRINSNDSILFKVGMTYFDYKRDYTTALRFFQQVNENEIPDVRYYKTLATIMGNMNIDYEVFTEELYEFTVYTDGLPNGVKKIDNYHSLANIYGSYKGQIPGANTLIIELINNAYGILERIGDDRLIYTYEYDFEHKLAQAYHSRAINSSDVESAREDFLQAIEHYHNIIELDVQNLEEAIVRIGVIYQQMGENSQAIEQYRLAISHYPDSIDAYVRLANLLLDIEQNKSEGKRNFKEAKRVYEQAGSLEEADSNEGFNRLTRRLNNLNALGN
ncbi:serine/threonine-protein kinase [Alkalihalobacterium elongatum]|uniref:serine/threonine-protein kinase n=1 Tax=Alkalihalobacterium elongatum TaxID=2675466 RepID=UPI001C1F56C3|nr:serine/threonine-protein kinase [Alkalihalobacterium elongatum]